MLIAVVVACGVQEPAVDGGGQPATDPLACDSLARFRDAGEALVQRSVADLDVEELSGLLAQRRGAVQRADGVVDGDEAEVLSRFVQEAEVADAALVGLWDANRDRVAEIGRTWDWVLMQSASEEERDAYFAARSDRATVYDVLEEACGSSELPVAEETPGAVPIESGVLGFMMLGGSQELGFAGTGEGAVSPVGLPEGAEGVTTLDVSRDGLRVAVNGWGPTWLSPTGSAPDLGASVDWR